MNSLAKYPIAFLAAALGASAVLAQDSDVQLDVQGDSRAIDVLKAMSAYTASLDRLIIRGESFSDAELGEGLIVSNASEVTVTIDRPASMLLDNFDGLEHKKIFFDDGLLTVFRSARGFYAQANVPKEIEAAMEFALDELGVEAPLMDLIYRDPLAQLVSTESTVMYLTDKARVDGTDCHHIVIRYPEIDLQLWVEEGDRPVARRITITHKWSGGAPRFTANLSWESEPRIDQGIFEFQAPEGSRNIGFATDRSAN